MKSKYPPRKQGRKPRKPRGDTAARQTAKAAAHSVELMKQRIQTLTRKVSVIESFLFDETGRIKGMEDRTAIAEEE